MVSRRTQRISRTYPADKAGRLAAPAQATYGPRTMPCDVLAHATAADFVPGFRAIRLGPYEGRVEHRADGTVLVRSTDPLRDYPTRHTERLQRWAAERPHNCFLAQRQPDGGWRRLNYRYALAKTCALAQALLERGLGPERPLMILSGNNIEHALLALAAQHIGMPYVPGSPVWSTRAGNPGRLRHAVELLTPGMVFAADAVHHAAGNNNFGPVLFHGGTLYIDDGKPTPDGMAQTVAKLRELAPTIYYTVPKGLEMLVREMRADAALSDRFFSRLRLVYPAGSALSVPLHAAFDELALATCGARIPMSMGLGMTETAPVALSAHLPGWQSGVIGLPAPGVSVKLAPVGDKLEGRYRGPNVTPGCWRQPALTREAFDDEGWFRSGDAARFIDEAAPERGLRFDGRIAEDLTLTSGTWVNVGAVRSAVITAGAPYVQDAVITGHDRDRLGMLLFLLPAAAELMAAGHRQAAETATGVTAATVATDPAVRGWAQRLLDRLAAQAGGSSQRIERAWLLADPPSAALGEITDKGSINQRACLRHRAALVEALHAARPEAPVLVAAPGAEAVAEQPRLRPA